MVLILKGYILQNLVELTFSFILLEIQVWVFYCLVLSSGQLVCWKFLETKFFGDQILYFLKLFFYYLLMGTKLLFSDSFGVLKNNNFVSILINNKKILKKCKILSQAHFNIEIMLNSLNRLFELKITKTNWYHQNIGHTIMTLANLSLDLYINFFFV